jgi:hypothetical protein
MLGTHREQKIQPPHPPPKEKKINHPNACHFTSLVAKKQFAYFFFAIFYFD